ncbi:hypothetical protein [uncultured Methanolobus sp.]|uniref:hypothetical protein n=1 Tax=uncultured Methanolobus sp. TaxID=218300 RepID=UPI002AAAB979|nr:hypothetical protein [uncultured Methanolobus sp.]
MTELEMNDKARVLFGFIKAKWGIRAFASINCGDHVLIKTTDGQDITISMKLLMTSDMGEPIELEQPEDDEEESPFWEIDFIKGVRDLTGYQQTNFRHIYSSWRNSLGVLHSLLIPVNVEALSDHKFKLYLVQLEGDEFSKEIEAEVILDEFSKTWDFAFTS